MLLAAHPAPEGYVPWTPAEPQRWGVYVAYVGIPGRMPYATGLDSEIRAHKMRREALARDRELYPRLTWKYIVEKENDSGQ